MSCCVAWRGAVPAEDAGAAADLVRNMGRMVLALEPWRNRRASIPGRANKHGV